DICRYGTRRIQIKKDMPPTIHSIIMMVGCSRGKYPQAIHQAVKQQAQYQKVLADKQKGDVESTYEKKDSNISVYENGKYVIIAYKPLKDDDEIHYYTYKIKDDKAHYLENFNTKGYTQKHEPDYKEEKMDLEES